MKNYILLLLGFVVLHSCVSIKKEEVGVQKKAVLDQKLQEGEQTFAKAKFPEDYMGKWKGELNIFNPSGKAQTIEMGLNILPIDGSENLTFTIIYGEDKPENYRNYELITVDKEKNTYLMDEKNSILIDAYYVGGKLFQTFEVVGNLIACTLSKKGSNLYWEISSTKLDNQKVTGGQEHEGEDIAEVKSYRTKVFQEGILSRMSH